MVRKQLTLGVLFLLMSFRQVALAQISDGGKAPQVPGLARDMPDDGPLLGGDNPACQDIFYATSNAECAYPGGGGDHGGFTGSVGPVWPVRPPKLPTPANVSGGSIAGLGILPGENSINFPVGPLILADLLGLNPGTQCGDFAACLPSIESGFTPYNGPLMSPEQLKQTNFMLELANILYPIDVNEKPPKLHRPPYRVLGTDCNKGCHPEPPATERDPFMCKNMAVLGFTVGAAAGPWVEGPVAYAAYGLALGSGAYGVAECD